MADDGWATPAAAGWGAPTSVAGGWGDAGAGSTPTKSGCFKCGEEGHMKSQCSQPDKPRGCFRCGQEGHSKADCPNPPAEGERKPRACFKCGEEGHSKADCPQSGEGGGSDDRKCFKCGEAGHNKQDCPQATDQEKAPRGCFKCGKEGHSKAECSEPDICRNCGAEGHVAKDCTEEAKTRVVKDKEGKDVEIYVPSERTFDQLFNTGIHSGINFDNFDKIGMAVSGDNPPPPADSFESMDLRALLKVNVEKSGYKKPTPIQKLAIPAAMLKRDMMCCAQTGSGKTAAFLLPIIHDLLESGCTSEFNQCQSPQALVIAPTRELAVQIKDEARKFSDGSMIKAVVVYGGTSTAFQSNTLQRGCNILIGTPGRIKDFLGRGKLSFDQIKFLVLDEADRLLDMGFSDDIKEIVSGGGMPEKGARVTMMFSATFQSEIQEMARDFLHDYLFLRIGIVGSANKDVTQTVHLVNKFDKREKLVEILRDMGSNRTMVFVETKKNCDFIASHLCKEGLPTTSIHGDRLQREREMALEDFRAGRMMVLVATNVAARGLDIRGVEHVVIFDLPEHIDDYVHRIGRTGRVGNTGKSTSFFDPSNERDLKVAPYLVHILAECEQEVPDFLAEYGARSVPGTDGFGAADIRGGAVVTEDDW